MKIQTVIDDLLIKALKRLNKTVDTVKSGDSGREVGHIGTCFMATADVVRRAKELGVDFLITHEPTYYDHFDKKREDSPIVKAKEALVEGSGITIWRYHDHIHMCDPDGIQEGVIDALGWKGSCQGPVFTLETPMTARDMAGDVKKYLGAAAVRSTGSLDTPFTSVLFGLGDPGSQWLAQAVREQAAQVYFFGEVSEWAVLEMVRDADAMGIPMAALTCGHAISEEMGMRLLAKKLEKAYPSILVDFIPTGEVYRYL